MVVTITNKADNETSGKWTFADAKVIFSFIHNDLDYP